MKKKKKNIRRLITQFVHVIKLRNVHVAAKTCVLRLSRVSRGEMRVCERIPGRYFHPEKYLSVSPSPGEAAECGANALPGQVAGKVENASPGTVLEGGYVSGPPVDGFA